MNAAHQACAPRTVNDLPLRDLGFLQTAASMGSSPQIICLTSLQEQCSALQDPSQPRLLIFKPSGFKPLARTHKIQPLIFQANDVEEIFSLCIPVGDPETMAPFPPQHLQSISSLNHVSTLPILFCMAPSLHLVAFCQSSGQSGQFLGYFRLFHIHLVLFVEGDEPRIFLILLPSSSLCGIKI